MGKQLSPAMKEATARTLANLGGGKILNMKDFKEATYRLYPVDEAHWPPGVKVVKVNANQIKKFSTSPNTFGKPCPICDKISEMKRNMDKDEKEEFNKTANISVEKWMWVCEVGKEGTVEAPAHFILPMKSNPYTQFMKKITVSNENITDPDEGRAFVYQKEGSGQYDTKYCIADWKDSSPIHKDPKMRAAMVKLAKTLDPMDQVYPVDWTALEDIYSLITQGESIPQHYYDDNGAKKGDGARGTHGGSAPAANRIGKGVPANREPAPEPTTQSETPDAGEQSGFAVDVRVTFEDADGKTHAGMIVREQKDEESGDPQFVVVSDEDGDEYAIFAESLTLEEEAPPEVTEPEPEPEKKPKVIPRGKPAANKPAPKKPAPKSVARGKVKAPAGKAGTASSKVRDQLRALKKS